MTHVVHPYAHRLGILRDWKSRWFGGPKGKYQEYLKADILIREFLAKKISKHHLGGIEIERNDKTFRIIIKTSRAGIIIGRSGEGVKNLKEGVIKLLRKAGVPVTGDIRIDVEEIRSPEANAELVAGMVSEGLEKRTPFRRVLKLTIDKVMANRDVKGVKISVSGRLGGAEMARREYLKRGRIPLTTFRADIDFARKRASLPYGDIGIKVWIYKGDVFETKNNK